LLHACGGDSTAPPLPPLSAAAHFRPLRKVGGDRSTGTSADAMLPVDTAATPTVDRRNVVFTGKPNTCNCSRGPWLMTVSTYHRRSASMPSGDVKSVHGSAGRRVTFLAFTCGAAGASAAADSGLVTVTATGSSHSMAQATIACLRRRHAAAPAPVMTPRHMALKAANRAAALGDAVGGAPAPATPSTPSLRCRS